MTRLGGLAILFLLLTTQTVWAQRGPRSPYSGYFFPPERTLFYFRPDLYVLARYGYSGFGNYCARPIRGYGNYWNRYAPGPYPIQYGGGATGGIYRVVLSSPPTGGIVRANTGDVVFDVSPPRAFIFLNDKLIGSGRDFTSEKDRIVLVDGDYRLRVECSGYQPFQTILSVTPDRTLHLEIDLDPLETIP